MIRVVIITVSDRSSKGDRKDASGPCIREWAEAKGYTVVAEDIIPDEYDIIRSRLVQFSDAEIDLIFTTGGTGFAPRDVTPEATLSVIDRQAPGIADWIRLKSMEITPHGMLSRAVSGIRKKSLIVNLPGSPRAVRENLSFIEKALPHAVELLGGNVGDCAVP